MNGFLIGDAVTGAALMSVALRPAMGISGFANAEGNEKTSAAATAAYIFTFLHRANEAMGVSATLYKNFNPHEEFMRIGGNNSRQNNNKKDSQKSAGETAAERDEWWKAISDYKEVSSPEFLDFLTTRIKRNSDSKNNSNEKMEEDAKANFYQKDHDNMEIGSLWSFPKNASPVPRFSQTNQDGSELSLFIYLHPYLPIFCLAVDTIPISAPSNAGGFCDDDDDGTEERSRLGFPPVGAYVSAAMANLFIRDHGHLILKSVVKSQQIKPADLKAAKKAILPKMKAVYRRAVRGVVADGIENLLRSIPSSLLHRDEDRDDFNVSSSQTTKKGGCGKSKFEFELEPSHESVGSLKPPGAPPLTSSTDIGIGGGGAVVAERFSPLIQTVLRLQKQKREESERAQRSKNMVSSAATAKGEEKGQNDGRNNNGNNATATAGANVSNNKNKYPIQILSTSLVLVNFEAPPQITGAFKPKLTKEEKEAEKRREAEQQMMMLNGKKKPKNAVGGGGVSAAVVDLTGSDDAKGEAANSGVIGLFFIAPSSQQQQQQQQVEKSKFEVMPALQTSYRWAAAEGRRIRQQLIIGARLDAKNSVHRAAIGHHLVHQLTANLVTTTKTESADGGGGHLAADDITSRKVNLLRAYNALYSNASLATRTAPSSLMMMTASPLLGSGFGDNNNRSTTSVTANQEAGGSFPPASPFIHSPSSVRRQFETMLLASPSSEISNVFHNNNNNGGNTAVTMSSSVASPLDALLASSSTSNKLASAATNVNAQHQQIGNSSNTNRGKGTNTTVKEEAESGEAQPLRRVGSPSKANSISRLVSLLLQSSGDAALMLAGLSASSSQQRSHNPTTSATETAVGPSKPAGAASAAVGWNTNTFVDGIAVPAAVASIFDNVAFPKITITNQVDIVGPLSVGGGSDESVGAPITRVAANAAATSGGIDPRPSLKQLTFEQKLTEALVRERHQHHLNGKQSVAVSEDKTVAVGSDASPPTQRAPAAPTSIPTIPTITAAAAQSIVPTTQIHRVVIGISLSPVCTISVRLNFRVVVRSPCTSLQHEHARDYTFTIDYNRDDNDDLLLDFPSSTEATEYIRNFTKRFVDGLIVVSGAIWRPCLRILFENDIPLS